MEDTISKEIRKIIREELEAALQKHSPPVLPTVRTGLLTEEEASLWLSVPISTLRDWRQRRINVPYIQLSSRKIRYSQTAVQEFLSSVEVKPDS